MNRKDTYFKVYRSLLEHEIWLKEPFTRGQAWVDLIGMANFGTTEKYFRGELQIVGRGQIKASMQFFQKRWKWSRNRVIHYFKQLEVQGMVTTKGTNNGTTITIENYALFQDSGTTKSTTEGITESTTEGITEGTQNKNNIKNNKKKERLCFDANGNPYMTMVDESFIVDAQSKNPEGEFYTDDEGNEYFIPKGGA